jgi:hypothetical protein
MSILGNSVGGLFPTPQQIGAATLKDVQKAAPVNLLDNSDFRNPVNQRGQKKYEGEGYTIDRWNCWYAGGVGTLTVNDGYISFNGGANGGTFAQRLERGILDSNKTYTMAYQKLSGEIAVFPAVINYNFSNHCDLLTLCTMQNATEDMVWAALYEGEYTEETLPEYHPKGYGAELAECQRHQIVLDGPDVSVVGVGIGASADVSRVLIFTPVEMRVIPSITLQDGAQIYVHSEGSFTVATTIDSVAGKNAIGVTALLPVSLGENKSCSIQLVGGKLLLDANL